MSAYLFTSARLGFRSWRESDLPDFIQLNADPAVMRFISVSSGWSPEDSARFLKRIQAHFLEHGFGIYAVELLNSAEFIGIIGFKSTALPTDGSPCIEILWRLKPSAWHQGLGTEGAGRCLEYGVDELGFQEVFAWCDVANRASARVMEKVGMGLAGHFEMPGKDGRAARKYVFFSLGLR